MNCKQQARFCVHYRHLACNESVVSEDQAFIWELRVLLASFIFQSSSNKSAG